MTSETVLYSSLLLSMVLGAVIVVFGIFYQNGIGSVAALGSVFILVCVGGLAYLAAETEVPTKTASPRTGSSSKESEQVNGEKST
ncbi:hypothetical protein [Natrinema caseinilyticum]|uniref:hypothetical protein n=1 Tax=Natrinema caseinilyticum TaxID=2961570 RepID=UPI0020C32316|nr:hypothetical protein [Natrinema caseinilyticum]